VRERLPARSILRANKLPSLDPSIPAGLSDRVALMPERRRSSPRCAWPAQVLYAALVTL